MNPILFFKKIKWSTRKLLLPIPRNALVLEVGSGGNPHPFSSVLVERYISDKHRLKPIEIDKRLILADASKLPFKDLTFDYSLSFHVLEHVETPSEFLKETQRTSKAGYIETPNFLYERLKPFDVHLLEVANIEETLHIRKKESADPDTYISELNLLEKAPLWKKLFTYQPELFHVQLYWKNKINYIIYNSEISSKWFEEPEHHDVTMHTEKAITKNSINFRKLFIKLLKLTRPKKNLDDSFFVCPDCKGHLKKDQTHYLCTECSIKFKHTPIPDFTKSEAI